MVVQTEPHVCLHARVSSFETMKDPVRRTCGFVLCALVLAQYPPLRASEEADWMPQQRPKHISAEFERLDQFTRSGCGACIAAGGAWCLPVPAKGSPFGLPPQCVPDARGMCGTINGATLAGQASGGDDPSRHVGIAGTGRCPDSADFEMQAYFHAPRRQPLEPSAMLQAEGASCDTVCSQRALSDVVEAAVAEAQEAWKNVSGGAGRTDQLESIGALTSAFLDCGAVVLPLVGAAGTRATSKDKDTTRDHPLANLRELTVAKLGLAASADTAIAGRAGRYLVPGVRGNARAEFVLPATTEFTNAVMQHVLTPPIVTILAELLGHSRPAIEFASVMVSWPGAEPQEFHRDAGAGSEAALLLFVPLEAMVAADSGNGPPEMCLCTHHPRAGVGEGECPGPRLTADADVVPVGSVLVYDPGMVHRGLANRASMGFSTSRPRVMLHLVIAPTGAPLRARPHGFLTTVAQEHIRRWRALDLGSGAVECGALTAHGCEACLAGAELASVGVVDEGISERGKSGGASQRTGCAWCVHSSSCVPDLAGVCPRGPREHVGTSGLGGTVCPAPVSTRRADL